ncbi:MAG TPA: SDR family NAD(P)-dependent oxidoreductase [Desulfomonilaceae bacterium]|nr:SDR family NAD(P)-dependent oxidoreductase [Desulfomonilaceae bacterium]
MNVQHEHILVTGAGGFIGSHLCEELVQQGARVRAMIRYNSLGSHGLLEHLPKDVYESLDIVPGDVRDSHATAKAVSGCRLVFHLAALIGIPYSYHAPKSYVDTNVCGTLNVLQACLEAGVERVVHTSTSEVYGTARYTPIDENHPLQGQSPYSASKIAADKIAESFHLSFNLPVVTIRPFNCFGPRQSARAFIPAMISQLLNEAQVRCGLLTPVRDYTFVKDTVSGFILCGTMPGIEGMTINVGSGQKISMRNLLYRIMDRTNEQKETVSDLERVRPEKSEVMALVCDNSKAKTFLGWTPKYSLDEGLDQVIDYFRNNRRLVKTDHYVV